MHAYIHMFTHKQANPCEELSFILFVTFNQIFSHLNTLYSIFYFLLFVSCFA